MVGTTLDRSLTDGNPASTPPANFQQVVDVLTNRMGVNFNSMLVEAINMAIELHLPEARRKAEGSAEVLFRTPEHYNRGSFNGTHDIIYLEPNGSLTSVKHDGEGLIPESRRTVTAEEAARLYVGLYGLMG